MKWFCIILFFLSSFLGGCSRFYPHKDNTIPSGLHSGNSLVYDVKDLQDRIISTKELDPEKEYLSQQSLDKLELLVDYFLSDFQYAKASSYFQELIQKTNAVKEKNDSWNRLTLMKILINDMDPSTQSYDQLRLLLSGYAISGFLNSEQYDYYAFTLDLLDKKFVKEDINKLTGHYIDFKNQLRKQFDVYYSYKDAPEYYLWALFSVVYFKQQEFGVAKQLANMAIAQNPNYILPYQIKTYIGLLTKEYNATKQSLDVLTQIDSDTIERYQFLLGLMYYNQNNLPLAKNYFLQMKSPRLRTEGLRYLIDLERKTQSSSRGSGGNTNSIALSESDKAILRYLEELFLSDSVGHLQPVDFQAVYDRYIFDKIRIGSGGTLLVKQLYDSHSEVLDKALSVCPTILTGSLFICDYGKGGKLLIDGEWNKAMKTLIPLVKKYPDWQMYYIIGLLYKEQGLLDNAKIYFGKALQYIDQLDQKKNLSEMMIELLNKGFK